MKIVNNEANAMFPLAQKYGQIVATVQELYEEDPPGEESSSPPHPSISQTFLSNSDLGK